MTTLADLVKSLPRYINPDILVLRRKGVITNPSNVNWTNKTVDVYIGGDTDPIKDCPFASHVHPIADRTVWVDFVGASPMIVAAQGAPYVETWVPQLVQSGNRTSTVNYAEYQRHGNWVTGSVSVIATQAGSAGNEIGLSPPFTAAQGAFLSVGAGFIFDASANLDYSGTVALSTTTRMVVLPHNVAGAVGITPSFALANPDEINMSFAYRAA